MPRKKYQIPRDREAERMLSGFINEAVSVFERFFREVQSSDGAIKWEQSHAAKAAQELAEKIRVGDVRLP